MRYYFCSLSRDKRLGGNPWYIISFFSSSKNMRDIPPSSISFLYILFFLRLPVIAIALSFFLWSLSSLFFPVFSLCSSSSSFSYLLNPLISPPPKAFLLFTSSFVFFNLQSSFYSPSFHFLQPSFLIYNPLSIPLPSSSSTFIPRLQSSFFPSSSIRP